MCWQLGLLGQRRQGNGGGAASIFNQNELAVPKVLLQPEGAEL
jgi:hypothetical protein